MLKVSEGDITFSRGQSTEGSADLLVDTSYYNFYQPSRYPTTYYSNLYNYQQYQMPNGESRLSSHNVSPQYRMHSYYSSASYLSQGLDTHLHTYIPTDSLARIVESRLYPERGWVHPGEVHTARQRLCKSYSNSVSSPSFIMAI
uniref:Uncharacterized protein n=1 Tax=Hucho hucho TaxID=62062 RepID=A0A4W5KJ72_9TELE